MPSSLSLYLTECCHIFCLGATGLLLFPSRPIWFVPKLLVRQHSGERDVLFVVGANTLNTVSLTTQGSPSYLTSHIGPSICLSSTADKEGSKEHPVFPKTSLRRPQGARYPGERAHSIMLKNRKFAEGILGHLEHHSTSRNYPKPTEN